ncbi:Lrp/AsnC family transcriptional regulator [Nocardioides marinquilinus]|uniref:Lrp/AsnC family transcriptional regulator n=1 Tax=Nocardioides marinquilinus TaxID=1210400 RepID=A0ABP9P974_9ACTN
MDQPIDDVGRRIVELLQADGRMSYAALSQQVGLSEAAVRQRVNKMTADGTMQVVAVTDPLQLGFRRQAMVGITVQGPLEPVAEALAAIDEVTYLVLVAGGFDLLCEVLTADDEGLLDLLSSRIRAVPGVTATQTLTYLRLVKQTYAWGTR